MCGRYTITISLEELMVRYMIDETMVPYHRPKYNVAPSQLVFAVIHDGQRNRLGELKWGLVPPWADDPKIGFMMINARAETAASKPAFREPLRRKRCIIPADGFYEWKKDAGGKNKQPMRIVKRDRSVFSMAGLYEIWQSPAGEKISSCTILTTEPNEVVAPIHDRMPVILRPEDEALWLNRGMQDPDKLAALFVPYPDREIEAYPVGAAVGNVRNDEPSLILPRQSDGQMELW
ncbi:SOS response-associated peptidase [Paenibacillus sp. LHD-117]|uniref:SOS response-associated peptidase n=1 Tax=Paenibacillus sp. LHD-117 TaxID=3071412 RepID=UPI0027E0CCC4|nr:SOS response-associated peptidase [Paenibacillus sp. LHD-117]MDQ6420814.1 SOS response-associated peptidase [Paenibacillus sp. LHD-117]